MNVGFLGTGRMGLPMCANLVRAGHAVGAFDVRPECAAAVEAVGARWDPAAAERAEVLITMLPGPLEVEQAMLGGTLAALRPGATWIDMSTGSPEVLARVSERARGIAVLDAPVSGGVAAARAGTLLIYAGGDADDVARCAPLLRALGEVRHVGAPGAGITIKLIVNLLWFGQAVATAEALLLGKAAGIDLRVLHEALAAGPAAGAFVRDEVDRLLAGDYRASFGLDRCVEELATVTAHARALGVPCALSEHVEQVHRRALERFGSADGELLAVALLEEEAGMELRAPGT